MTITIGEVFEFMRLVDKLRDVEGYPHLFGDECEAAAKYLLANRRQLTLTPELTGALDQLISARVAASSAYSEELKEIYARAVKIATVDVGRALLAAYRNDVAPRRSPFDGEMSVAGAEAAQ